MRLLGCCLLVAVAASAAVAERALVAGQTRDTVGPPTTGTASISGVVVDDQDPARPVRRAVVTLTGTGLRPNRGAITDDDGRFTLEKLPAGRFALMAERGGYVASMYGAKRPARPGTDITLTSGQQLADLRVALWRGAVVAGVLRDERGEPLPNTTVTAIPIREVTPATLTLNNNRQTTTNDLGEYRIFGLEPGTYVVRTGDTLAGQVRLTPAEVSPSEADVDATFAALAARARQSATNARPGERVSSPPTLVNAAPIFFPGTPAVGEATPITLKAGEERGNLDFEVRRIRSATLRGTVAGRDGAPVSGAFVRLAAAGRTLDIPGIPSPVLTADSGSTGAFSVSPVAPGNYTLLVRGTLSSAAGPGGGTSSGPMGWTLVPISVAGPDLDLGTVTLQPGMTLSGRVVFDSTAPPPDASVLRLELRSESLAITPAQGRGGTLPGARFLAPTTVRSDGTFQATDLVPGDYRIAVAGPPSFDNSVWWTRSATWRGRDLLDTPLQVAPSEDITGVTVVLTDRRTEISGTIATPNGSAVSDLFVLAFPADAALRIAGSRRTQAVRPDSSGHFVLRNLPPGDYLVCALTDVDDGQWNDAGFLDPLVGASTRVTLGEGENKVQDFRVRGN